MFHSIWLKKVVMKCFKRVSAFLCLLFVYYLSTGYTPAADPAVDCIEQIRNMYKKMDIKDLDQGFVYMNFTMITQYPKINGHEEKKTKADIEYIIGKEKMQYQTKDVKVYTDMTDNFTIIPSRKTIFWSNSMMNMGTNKRVKDYQLLQDSIFSSCTLVACKAEVNKEKNYNKVVTLQLMEKAKKKYPYNKLIFFINTATNEIKKVVIDYPADADFSQIEIVYNKIQHNYQNNTLDVPAKALVFSANGILNNEYKNFKLVDDRSKPKSK